MVKKILITATVQSHICQFHKPLVDVLHEQGYIVHVAGKNNLAEKNGLKLDFADKVFDIPFSRSPKSIDNIKAYKLLKKIIEKENYDIVHCNTPMGGIISRLAAKKSRKSGTRVIYTAHGFHFYKGAPLKNWFIFYPIEKLFSIISDSIITINHEDYNLARNKFYTKINYIHGVGVDEKRYHPITLEEKNLLKQKLELVEFSKIILCIGELLPNKNQKMVIQSMSEIITKYPDCLLLIAGNGPEKNNLEALIEKINLNNNVKLLGYSTCLEKYQGIADVVVSCSKREGLPLNIVEAMLSSNPVVATRNRGHCELISHGKTGYLVDVDDFVSMSNYIKELFENPDKLKIMGLEAQKFAEQYSFKNVKQELRNIYLDYDIGEGGH